MCMPTSMALSQNRFDSIRCATKLVKNYVDLFRKNCANVYKLLYISLALINNYIFDRLQEFLHLHVSANGDYKFINKCQRCIRQIQHYVHRKSQIQSQKIIKQSRPSLKVKLKVYQHNILHDDVTM